MSGGRGRTLILPHWPTFGAAFSVGNACLGKAITLFHVHVFYLPYFIFPRFSLRCGIEFLIFSEEG